MGGRSRRDAETHRLAVSLQPERRVSARPERPPARTAQRAEFRGRMHADHPAGHRRPGAAAPQCHRHRQDAGDHRRPVRRPPDLRSRRRLDGRGVRHSERAVRQAWSPQRRDHPRHERVVDQRQPRVFGPVLPVRGRRLRTPPGAAAPPADLDRRPHRPGPASRGRIRRRLAGGRLQPAGVRRAGGQAQGKGCQGRPRPRRDHAVRVAARKDAG